MFSASRTPAGMFQHCLMRACSAPTQLMVSFCACARRRAERRLRIDRVAGHRVAFRIALVEQGGDLRLVEGALLLRLLVLLRLDLGLFLLDRLLLLFLLQRFGDRIDLLLLLLLDRLRRLGLLLRRLRLRRLVVGGDDFLLLGHLADRLVDRLRLADLLDQRLRIFLLAGLGALGDLRELLGGDDIDRQRLLRLGVERAGRKRQRVPSRSPRHAGRPMPRATCRSRIRRSSSG